MTWLISLLTFIILLWTFILFVDAYLKKFHCVFYLWFLDKCGLTLKVGQIQWITTKINRMLMRLGSRYPRFFRVWFNVGAVVAVLLFIPAIIILILTIWNNFNRTSTNDEDDDGRLLLKPVLPGVNLPGSHLPFYITTLVISLLFHELGHGLAAVQEDVRIFGCGVMLVGVLPAAFVHFSTEQLLSLHPWRQLKVFSAGIWHNVVLVVLAALVLLFSPFLFSLGYTQGVGVIVQDAHVGLEPSLMYGDMITAVDGCQVTDFNSWYECLYKVASTPQIGQCIAEEHLEIYKWNITGLSSSVNEVNCCRDENLRDVCFMWINPSTDPQKIKGFACAPARQVLERSEATCFSEEECNPGCACVIPSVYNDSRLIRISRHGRKEGLLIQRVSDIYYSVTTSNFIPKSPYFPIILPFGVDIFLRYVISFSGALALLNTVPCHALDGQWLISSILQLIPISCMKKRITCQVIVWCGTILLGLTVYTGISTIT